MHHVRESGLHLLAPQVVPMQADTRKTDKVAALDKAADTSSLSPAKE